MPANFHYRDLSLLWLNGFDFLSHLWQPLFVSSLIAVATSSSALLIKNGQCGSPSPVPDMSVNASSFPSLSAILPIGL